MNGIPSSRYHHNSSISYPMNNSVKLTDYADFTTPVAETYHYNIPYNHLIQDTSSEKLQEPPVLVASSSSTTAASTLTSSSVDFLNETFTKAMSLPDSFYPEFLQYSKDSYEQSTSSKNRKSNDGHNDKCESSQVVEQEIGVNYLCDRENKSRVSSNELRRQIHIQSEQKRRAQIKDGFEELRSVLPTCINKKMSKVALLHKTVQHIQHLKLTQASILSELERLVHENEQLRKFQQSVLQKYALENMYTTLP